MTTINANTKIAYLLKQHPDAMEAIISISPAFNKLRIPLLRKLIAARTSIRMACKIGGCSIDDFYAKLQPLGFVIDKNVVEEKEQVQVLPDFMKNLTTEQTIVIDVRSMLDEGKDPFKLIHELVNQLQPQQVLKLINSFEPIPLIHLLEKQGFKSYMENIDDKLVYTYFYKPNQVKPKEPELKSSVADWDTILKKYETHLVQIDVRQLEMPLPMLTILEALENLKQGEALFVFHKRIPVFLLPELQDRKFEYLIKEINDAEVHLLIFRA